jgi:hypothetical protein
MGRRKAPLNACVAAGPCTVDQVMTTTRGHGLRLVPGALLKEIVAQASDGAQIEARER